MQADIGLVGLAVMGENLVLNMAGRGFTVAVYNRTTSKSTPSSRAGRRACRSSAPTLPRSWSPNSRRLAASC